MFCSNLVLYDEIRYKRKTMQFWRWENNWWESKAVHTKGALVQRTFFSLLTSKKNASCSTDGINQVFFLAESIIGNLYRFYLLTRKIPLTILWFILVNFNDFFFVLPTHLPTNYKYYCVWVTFPFFLFLLVWFLLFSNRMCWKSTPFVFSSSFSSSLSSYD